MTIDLGHKFEKNELFAPFFLVGDSAYTCKMTLIITGNDDGFNFEQRLLRINIDLDFCEIIRR